MRKLTKKKLTKKFQKECGEAMDAANNWMLANDLSEEDIGSLDEHNANMQSDYDKVEAFVAKYFDVRQQNQYEYSKRFMTECAMNFFFSVVDEMKSGRDYEFLTYEESCAKTEQEEYEKRVLEMGREKADEFDARVAVIVKEINASIMA